MTNWLSKLNLCLQSQGIAALRPLSELVLADPNEVFFQPYNSILGKNGNGRELEMGFPIVLWRWDWLPQTDIDVLQGYERQDVYIKTEVWSGVRREHKLYACYLQRLRLGTPILATSDELDDTVRQKRSVLAEFAQPVEYSAEGTSFV